LFTLCVWAGVVLPASAGWDNVFQPTLFRRQQSSSSYYIAPAPCCPPAVVAHSAPPCEEKKCTTAYVQRCYYQPVTTYQTKTVMEQVTTMQTSYYYAPVTTYRYSSYYDPCTCSYHQVATPQCGYELRAKQCPVQSWVSRCVQVPVQSYQRVDYWQPVTTCCSTTLGAPIGGPAPAPMPPAAAPMPSAPLPADLPPSIRGEKTPGSGTSKQPMWNQFYPPIEKSNDNFTPGASFKLGIPTPVQPQAPAPQPPVKLNQIAVGDSNVEGQVVRSDSSPKPNAKVLFINASTGKRATVSANSAGRFQVDLPAGSWHVYLHGADDLPIYQNRIDVNDAQTRQMKLVSRSN
jgi:hypothetical protein